MTGGELLCGEANAEIWQLLMLMSTQWLADFTGRYGLNFQVIIEGARELEIPIDRGFFRKVKAFESEVLEHERGGAGCDEKKKAICREMFGDNLAWACEHCEDKKME